MSEPLRVESGELTVDEILDVLHEGRRVVVQVELLSGAHEVMFRRDGAVFYCDTPMAPHKHEDEDGIRAYVLKVGYAKEQRRCGPRPWRSLVRL